VPQLTALAAQARDELGAQERGGRVFIDHEALIHDFAVEGRGIVVAGTFDDVVVGYGTGRTVDLHSGDVLGVIDDLYVEPEARGIGVGEAMMEELLVWFRERSCIGVDAYALPGMRATKNFFEGSGFTARLLVVHKKLEGRDGAS
jgi:GNAT superfamily N-acetyltransferase